MARKQMPKTKQRSLQVGSLIFFDARSCIHILQKSSGRRVLLIHKLMKTLCAQNPGFSEAPSFKARVDQNRPCLLRTQGFERYPLLRPG